MRCFSMSSCVATSRRMHLKTITTFQYTIMLKMADQRWFDISVVLPRSFAVVTGQLQMASLSLNPQFEINLMSNRNVIELLLQLKSVKAHGKNYIKVKPHLVRHLLRNRLFTWNFVIWKTVLFSQRFTVRILWKCAFTDQLMTIR